MRGEGLILRVLFVADAAGELGPSYAFELLVSQFVPPIFVMFLVTYGTAELFIRQIGVLALIFSFAPSFFRRDLF